jgi:hypothetical protein
VRPWVQGALGKQYQKEKQDIFLCQKTFVRIQSISCPTAWTSSSPREVGQRCNSSLLPIFYGQADADLNAEMVAGVLRREPGIDFQQADADSVCQAPAGLGGLD